MAVKNISKVYLLSVPLENDYKHTLYFTSKETQAEYFSSKVVKSYTDFSYQRKDNSIRVPENYDTIYNCNYVMYQNTAYSNKWFYAFIKELKFVNDEVTEVIIETDVIQTWLFDYTIKPSFVEREHVDNDTIGLHTIPEGLETGPYVCNLMQEDTKSDRLLIFMAYSDYSSSGDVVGDLYGGIYSGMGLLCYNTTKEGVEGLNKQIRAYDEGSKADAINSIFMGPAWLYEPELGYDDFVGGIIESSTGSKSYVIDVAKQTKLNGYTPRNKKLLCYPYNYLCASNNSGNAAIYNYEDFATDECQFIVQGVITPGMSIRMHPFSYKGTGNNYDEGLNSGKYPICCWNSDVYTNWLTQNSVNNALAIGSGILQIVGGAVTKNLGGIGSGVSTIADNLTQRYQASLIPDQVKGNTNSGDVVTASHVNKFIFYKMSIKKEYAQIIDKYFDMFGYQINMVKTPNKAHRGRYWYTKTIDVNIDGNLPNDDLQKIKNAYNNGITFWRNASEIQNYDLTNNIV